MSHVCNLLLSRDLFSMSSHTSNQLMIPPQLQRTHFSSGDLIDFTLSTTTKTYFLSNRVLNYIRQELQHRDGEPTFVYLKLKLSACQRGYFLNGLYETDRTAPFRVINTHYSLATCLAATPSETRTTGGEIEEAIKSHLNLALI